MAEDKEYNGFNVSPGEITLITFNNPKINVLSTPVLHDLVDALKSLSSPPGKTKTLVITGEGASFIAGADIKEMSGFYLKEAEDFAALVHRAMDAVEGFPAPVIAAVNGFALGGGCELSLACDLVIASEGAVFGMPEVSLGLIPGGGGTGRLPARIGKLKAKELIFTGRKVTSGEALAIGLINRVVPDERLMEEAFSLAKTIASKPVRSIEAAKALINGGTPEKEVEAFSSLFSYEDRKRLMRDFIEKKKS